MERCHITAGGKHHDRRLLALTPFSLLCKPSFQEDVSSLEHSPDDHILPECGCVIKRLASTDPLLCCVNLVSKKVSFL